MAECTAVCVYVRGGYKGTRCRLSPYVFGPRDEAKCGKDDEVYCLSCRTVNMGDLYCKSPRPPPTCKLSVMGLI